MRWIFLILLFLPSLVVAEELRPISSFSKSSTLAVGTHKICHVGLSTVDLSLAIGDSETLREGKSSTLGFAFNPAKAQELSFGCRLGYGTLSYSLLDQTYNLESEVRDSGADWSALKLHLESVKAGASFEMIHNLLTLEFGLGYYILSRGLARQGSITLEQGATATKSGRFIFVGLRAFINPFLAVEYEAQRGINGELVSLGRLGVNFHVRF